MRKIDLIVIHCSATRVDRTLTAFDLETLHRRRGFNGTGYHYYIRKDGTTLLTRPIERIGAHVKGFNASSIGICYEGGLDCRGRPADTRTPEQRASLRLLVNQLKQRFPACRVCGHRDLSPDLNGDGEIEPEEWIKACPCFEVKESFREVTNHLKAFGKEVYKIMAMKKSLWDMILKVVIAVASAVAGVLGANAMNL
ncbi:smalltalk protein [Bacteroides faecis]|nr:smalltalk protein [Bacteroides faecis]